MTASNRKNLILLAFTLVVIMLGFGIVIPIMPFYIEKLGASGKQLGLLTATYSIMQFVFAPIWGSVSDRVGRKPILMLGILGNGLFLLLFGLATKLWMLFLVRGLAGILSSATLPSTMAYISDSTSEKDRADGMGKLGAAMGLGVILGPGLGGWLAAGSLAIPFFIAAGLSLLALLLVALFLPESLPAASRQKNKVQVIQFGQLRRALFSPIGFLLFMAFLVGFGMTSFEGIFGLYALEKFDYGPQRVGTIMVVIGIVSVMAQGALTGPLTRRRGEATIIKATLLAASAGFLVMLTAKTFFTVLFTTGLFILIVALMRPAVTSLTSKRATLGQGAAMGLVNSFSSLGRIVGPIWAGLLFDVNYDYPFISGAVILFIGFLTSLIWVSGQRKQTARASLQATTG